MSDALNACVLYVNVQTDQSSSLVFLCFILKTVRRAATPFE